MVVVFFKVPIQHLPIISEVVNLYFTGQLLHGCQVFQNHRPDHSSRLGICLRTAAALFDLNRALRIWEADQMPGTWINDMAIGKGKIILLQAVNSKFSKFHAVQLAILISRNEQYGTVDFFKKDVGW